MLIERLDCLDSAQKIIELNSDKNIAYAIKDSQGRVISCNNMFLSCTGVNDIKELQGCSDKDIELWKDARYDYAIGEQISIASQTYYLSTESLPLDNRRNARTILTEKVPFIDSVKNYILVRFKVVTNEDLEDCETITPTNSDKTEIIFRFYFEPITLTPTEYRILRYMLEHNLDYASISKILNKSESQIKNTMSNIYSNLGIESKKYKNTRFLRSLLKYIFLPAVTKELSKDVKF